MKNDSELSPKTFPFQLNWALRYFAACFIAKDDLDGMEKFLIDIEDCHGKVITFMSYLFQNCMENQASKASYLAKEFTTHHNKHLYEILFVEEYLMWKDFNNQECIFDLLRRVEYSRTNGNVSPNFDVLKYS